MRQVLEELGVSEPREVVLLVVPSTQARVARANGRWRAVSDEEWTVLETAGAKVDPSTEALSSS